MSTFPEEVRLPQLVQLATRVQQTNVFPKCFVFDGRTPKTIFLTPETSHLWKQNRKGTWRRKKIIPVLSYQPGFYAVLIDNLSQKFRDNLSVPSSKIKLSIAWAVKMEPTGCPETSLPIYTV